MENKAVYVVGNVEFTVSRSFSNKMTVKELIAEIITRENQQSHT